MKLNALVRGTILIGLCLGIVCLGGPVVVAQSGTGVIRVAPSGSDVDGCGSAASPCQTIQYAVDEADSGDTILVAEGTYRYATADLSWYCYIEAIDPPVVCSHAKELTIEGGYTTSNWSEPDPDTHVTIIDGQDKYRGIMLYTASTDPIPTRLQLEGFTIQNCRAHGESNEVGVDTYAFGGGLMSERSAVVLRNVIFKDNRAIGGSTNRGEYGGAGSGGGVALRVVTEAVLEHVAFDSNQAIGGQGPQRGGYGIGGGFYAYRSVVAGDYITCTDNVAVAGDSAGIGWDSNGARADAQGGGIAIKEGTSAVLQHVTAVGNQAIGGSAAYAGGAFGGGVKVETQSSDYPTSLVLRDSVLQENLAQGGSGTTDGWLGNGGGIESLNSSLTLDRVQVIDNSALGGDGSPAGYMGAAGSGGVHLVRRKDFNTITSISNCVVADNLSATGSVGAVRGGGGAGIWLQGIEADIVHTTVARNRLGSTSMQGQGILVMRHGVPSSIKSEVDISYSIIAEHTGFPASSVATLHVKDGDNVVNLDRGLFAGNARDTNADGVPAPAGTFNGLGSMLSGSADFVYPGAPAYDYHILGSSSARDQASGSTMLVDIDSESRSMFGDPDIGADEYVPIVVAGGPVASRTIRLWWNPNPSLASGVHHYAIVFTAESGASSPSEGDSPINAGMNTNYTLTGLSNYKQYTFAIEARDASNALIADSNAVTIIPTDIFAYLPCVLK